MKIHSNLHLFSDCVVCVNVYCMCVFMNCRVLCWAWYQILVLHWYQPECVRGTTVKQVLKAVIHQIWNGAYFFDYLFLIFASFIYLFFNFIFQSLLQFLYDCLCIMFENLGTLVK